MAIETLEEPKSIKRYEWRCPNDICSAKLRGTARDCSYTDVLKSTITFRCPHCSWDATVPL
jgi:hypothetical protein